MHTLLRAEPSGREAEPCYCTACCPEGVLVKACHMPQAGSSDCTPAANIISYNKPSHLPRNTVLTQGRLYMPVTSHTQCASAMHMSNTVAPAGPPVTVHWATQMLFTWHSYCAAVRVSLQQGLSALSTCHAVTAWTVQHAGTPHVFLTSASDSASSPCDMVVQHHLHVLACHELGACTVVSWV